MLNVRIIGLGYVGLAMTALLSEAAYVSAYDVDHNKIEKLRNGTCPILDLELAQTLEKNSESIEYHNDDQTLHNDVDFVIVCLPTNFDEKLNSFDTSIIEAEILRLNITIPLVPIVIKSTLPIGFIDRIRNRFPNLSIFHSPEFLREGSAIRDNFYPDRIIIGSHSEAAFKFGELVSSCTKLSNVNILHCGAKEAEAIKLFSNTFLAMRVAFFNELDTLCMDRGMDTSEVILGSCYDQRIGDTYNNPSFGYGGYCLPKDTKQLLASFDKTPQSLIKAIVNSNATRKDYIISQVMRKNPSCVGVYKLEMKSGSDNFRESAILDLINTLVQVDVNVIVYEPKIQKNNNLGLLIENDFDRFCNRSDLILANRVDSKIQVWKHKLLSRDQFGRD